MPKATLLLRESLTNNSLTSIVERSQNRRPPLPEYELNLTSTQLNLIPTQPKHTSHSYTKPIHQTDEGFESDVDTLSLISSDDSFTSSTCLVDDHVLKHRENDSANGSASSDSDTETTTIIRTNGRNEQEHQHPLSDVLCYTDVKCPKVLVFVIKDTEVLVFHIEAIEQLQHFYRTFNTLKAVTNQRTYSHNFVGKFNLLQRTDNNGVTHIEIAREPQTKIVLPNESNIISIQTPDVIRTNKSADDSKLMLRSEFYPNNTLKKDLKLGDKTLKVWKSAEDLLDAPKRPERRRKPKGRAPPPPIDPNSKLQNVMKGQFVRVSVDPKKQIPHFEETKSKFQTFSTNLQTFTPNWNTLKQPKPKTIQPVKIYPNFKIPETNWTNSVPRLLRKPRSRSETRHPTPMAYRYIDTTRPIQQNYNSPSNTNTNTISNRLFGLSQKLKEFGTNVVSSKNNNYDSGIDSRRNSAGEVSSKNESISLKSVIKKDDKKTKHGHEHKKVTFSAYTTVQVV